MYHDWAFELLVNATPYDHLSLHGSPLEVGGTHTGSQLGLPREPSWVAYPGVHTT